MMLNIIEYIIENTWRMSNDNVETMDPKEILNIIRRL